MILELLFCQNYMKNTRASLQRKLAKQNLTHVMKNRKASCSFGHAYKLKTADNTDTTFFSCIAVWHLWIQLSRIISDLSWKIQSTSTLTPSSYQVTQFLIAGIESFQFFTDDVIKNPSINQRLPKFPNLGSIISRVTQDWFQGLIRECFKGQDTEDYRIFRAGNLVACTSLTFQLSWECSKSINYIWLNT